jgi:hypothetical protein
MEIENILKEFEEELIKQQHLHPSARRYSKLFKTKVAEAIEGGADIERFATGAGLKSATLMAWRTAYRKRCIKKQTKQLLLGNTSSGFKPLNVTDGLPIKKPKAQLIVEAPSGYKIFIQEY